MLKKVLGIAAAIVFAVAAQAHAQTVKVGVVPGAYADSMVALVPEAKEKGIDLEVVEFSDWTTPNIALQAGDIDMNYFQHRPFLDKAIADRGLQLTDLGTGILANLGLYSLKHKDFASIPEGGTVAIPSDPVNGGRGLVLVEKAGLIKLRDGVGFAATVDDVVENPKNLTFNEVEGPQLARITGDVDLAVGFPHFIVASGAFDPASALLFSGIEDKQFAIVFAVQEARKDDPVLKQIADLYKNSETVREAIHKAYNGKSDLYTLTWQP